MTVEEAIFEDYRGKRVLLDANLLLSFMIGSFQRSRIEVFKRTADFIPADFDILVGILEQFQTVLTTPHILTEVSNLSNSLPGHLKHSWWRHFQDQISLLSELHEPAATIAQETAFNPFGLTDAAIQNARKDTLILTEDFRLSGFLQLQGVSVLNFRHLRQTL